MQAEVNQQPLVISYLRSYFLSELQSVMCFAPKSSFLPTLPPPLELGIESMILCVVEKHFTR